MTTIAPLDAWLTALGRAADIYDGSDDTPTHATIRAEHARRALELARARDLHVSETTRTCARITGEPSSTDTVLLTVDAMPRHQLNIGVARALLAWDTFKVTGAFPESYTLAGWPGALADPADRRACQLLLETTRGRHRTWTDLARHHRDTRKLVTLDGPIRLDGRWLAVLGPFGEPLTARDDTEDLLARLLTDRTGDGTLPVHPGTGLPSFDPAALVHADLIDVVVAERALTLRTSRTGHGTGRSR